jgi:hypothetical protein
MAIIDEFMMNMIHHLKGRQPRVKSSAGLAAVLIFVYHPCL